MIQMYAKVRYWEQTVLCHPQEEYGLTDLLHLHTFCDFQQFLYRVIRANQHKTYTLCFTTLNSDHFCVVSNLRGSTGTAQDGSEFCGRIAMSIWITSSTEEASDA